MAWASQQMCNYNKLYIVLIGLDVNTSGASLVFSPTRETTNFARLVVLLNVCTQVLRETFDAIHPPANLHTVLERYYPIIQSLIRKNIINRKHWGQLYPSDPAAVSSSSFDIILLVLLLQNICGLPPPVTGWNKLPAVADVSREADIARVKYFRNTVYAHAEHASVDYATFNTYWQDIRDTLVRLGGVQYRAAIDNLETECMDPEIEDHYKELIRKFKEDDKAMREEVDNIRRKLEEVERHLKVTKRVLAEKENSVSEDIRDTLVRLGGVQYRAAIDNLETECMDPEIEDHYKELHSQWKRDEDFVKDQLNEAVFDLSRVTEELYELTK
ncbi:hypothetical protein ACROYT_G006752 [Oculina patagonica]